MSEGVIEHNENILYHAIGGFFWGMKVDEFHPVIEQLYAQMMGWA